MAEGKEDLKHTVGESERAYNVMSLEYKVYKSKVLAFKKDQQANTKKLKVHGEQLEKFMQFKYLE